MSQEKRAQIIEPMLNSGEREEEGMDEDANIELFLNLENIEDVEMSTDSSKWKRAEEGEECSSHA